MAKKPDSNTEIEEAEVVETDAKGDVLTSEDVKEGGETPMPSDDDKSKSEPEPVSEPDPDVEPEAENKPESVSEPVEEPEPEGAVEHVHEDEAGTSLSTHVLRGLFLIIVGIGIALWGAPKLAPMLPAGLAPVAEFLMPGQSEAKADVAALRTEMDARLAKLSETSQNSGVDEAAVAKAISEYDSEIRGDLAQIKDRLAATDGQDIEARLAKLETQITGVNAELSAVSERLSRQITENGVALSEEAASKLSGYQAALEGLKAQVAELASKNGALSQKVEEIATASARRVEEAQAAASDEVATTATKKLLTDIGAALESGAPFKPSLDGLEDVAKITAPDALVAIAETGTPSWTSLRNSYSDVAYEVLRVDAKENASDGVLGKFGAFLQTQVGTRSLERKEGTSTDAILSRVEDDLVNRRLSDALNEANSLPEAQKAAMSDWISQLSALTAAQSALDNLSAELGAT